MSRISVIALGTRGDVQPLALLAWQLQRGETNKQAYSHVSLITHAAHQVQMSRITAAGTAAAAAAAASPL
jgi:hypothetical protein